MPGKTSAEHKRGEPIEAFSVRLSARQRRTFDKLGGVTWLRAELDRRRVDEQEAPKFLLGKIWTS